MVRWHSVYLGKPPVRHITALRLSSRKRRSLVKQACKAWRAGGHSHRRSPVLHTDWINSSSSTAQGPAPRTCAVARTQASVTHADFFSSSAAGTGSTSKGKSRRQKSELDLLGQGLRYAKRQDQPCPASLCFCLWRCHSTPHRWLHSLFCGVLSRMQAETRLWGWGHSSQCPKGSRAYC